MFKVDLSIFLKCKYFFFTFQVVRKNKINFKYEILDFLFFLVNDHLNFIYALSTSKVKIIIY